MSEISKMLRRERASTHGRSFFWLLRGLRGVLPVAVVLAVGLSATGTAWASGHEAVAWGSGTLGQLGNGEIVNQDLPVHVCAVNATTPCGSNYLTEVIAVVGGGDHSLALLANHTVAAWGNNREGSLGDGNTKKRDVPELVCTVPTVYPAVCPASDVLKNVIAIAAGDATDNLALLANGEVRSWGSNENGDLGAGVTHSTLPFREYATVVCAPAATFNCSNGPLQGASLVASAPDHNAAIVQPGSELLTWGVNGLGQIGQGDWMKGGNDEPQHVCETDYAPVVGPPVPENTLPSCGSGQYLTGVEEIAFGTTHNIVQFSGPYWIERYGKDKHEKERIEVEGSHSVVAFGNNEFGELGNSEPVSGQYTLHHGGPAYCNQNGGYPGPCSTVPVHVCEPEWGPLGSIGSSGPCTYPEFLEPVTAVSAGGNNSMALKHEEVLAWGENAAGQVGDGKLTGPETCSFTGVPCSPVPSWVCTNATCSTHLKGISAISGGFYHDLALSKTGEVFGWGADTYGQLGNGPPAGGDYDLPVGVCASGGCPAKLTGVTAISAGNNHSLAVVECETFIEPFPTGKGVLPFASTSRAWQYTFHTGCGEPTAIHWVVGGGALPVGLTLNGGTGVVTGTPVAAGKSTFVVTATYGAEESVSATVSLTVVTPPDLGRCVKAEGAEGLTFADKGCTKAVEGASGKYEWRPGAEKAGFTTASTGAATLETVSGVSVICAEESGSGEYTGTGGTTNTVMHFTGCESHGQKCTTAGATEGELETSVLDGTLGWESQVKKKAALDLYAAEGGAVLGYRCGEAGEVTVEGSVLVPVKPDKMAASETLKFKGSKGHQKPEGFEGGERDVLLSSIEKGTPEQAALTVAVGQSDEEAIEINATV